MKKLLLLITLVLTVSLVFSQVTHENSGKSPSFQGNVIVQDTLGIGVLKIGADTISDFTQFVIDIGGASIDTNYLRADIDTNTANILLKADSTDNATRTYVDNAVDGLVPIDTTNISDSLRLAWLEIDTNATNISLKADTSDVALLSTYNYLEKSLSVNGTVNTNEYYKIDNDTILHVMGGQNVVLGIDAGGSFADYLLIDACTNIGYRAGYKNKVENLTAIGAHAGEEQSGGSNTFIGKHSGHGNTGSYSVFIGHSAGGFLSPNYNNGDYNTFVGSESGAYNDTGNYNTCLGEQSGYSNSTGSSNVFIGENSGNLNTTGGINTMIGRSSGGLNTEGNSNAYLGYLAGYNNLVGDYNTNLGTQAGMSNEGSNNIFIGYMSGYGTTGNNKLWIANSDSSKLITGDFAVGQIGINTSTFSSAFTIKSNTTDEIAFEVRNANDSIIASLDTNGVWQNSLTFPEISNVNIASSSAPIDTLFATDIQTATITSNSLVLNYEIDTLDYTATVSDYTIEMQYDNTVITLPTVTNAKEYHIVNTSSGIISINTNGTDYIGNTDTYTTYNLTSGSSVIITFNEVNRWVTF